MLLPSDVKIDSGLTAALGQTGKGPMNSLRDVYSRFRSRAASDARGPASHGVEPGGYYDSRLATGQGQSEAGLTGGLESVLGDSSYADFKGVRDYNQDYSLAREIGDLNKPSTLEEVLAGLSGAGRAGGQFYGLSKSLGRKTPKVAQASSPAYSDLGYFGSDLG